MSDDTGFFTRAAWAVYKERQREAIGRLEREVAELREENDEVKNRYVHLVDAHKALKEVALQRSAEAKALDQQNAALSVLVADAKSCQAKHTPATT